MSRRYVRSFLITGVVPGLLVGSVALGAVGLDAAAANASRQHHKKHKTKSPETSVYHDRATGTWYYAFVFSSSKPVDIFTVTANKLVAGASYVYHGTQTGCVANSPPTKSFYCSISSGPGQPPIPANGKIEAIYVSKNACGGGGLRATVKVNGSKTLSIKGSCRKTKLPL